MRKSIKTDAILESINLGAMVLKAKTVFFSICLSTVGLKPIKADY